VPLLFDNRSHIHHLRGQVCISFTALVSGRLALAFVILGFKLIVIL
jgi:hypothetical protein